MTEALLVLRKLSILREHMARLRRRRGDDSEAFAADTERSDAAALSLLVAAQEAADVSLHIAAGEGWGTPPSFADAFRLLADNGVLSENLAAELTVVVRLRNRIAHGYASVEPQRLHGELPAGIEALERFAEAVAKWLAPKPGDRKG